MDSFTTTQGLKLPVSDHYLLSVLNTTTPGTNYFDPPPNSSQLELRQLNRIKKQILEAQHYYQLYSSDFSSKTFLDIGTGNGAVPKLLQSVLQLKRSFGIDPYLDGEHKSSWQQHDHNLMLSQLASMLDIQQTNPESYTFRQISTRELSQYPEKYDLIYCKAIEHISDWHGFFSDVSASSSPGAIFYLKHRSFFGYLGPHRYASTFVPWGHLLMNDEDYIKYTNLFHPDRASSMQDFYQNGLANPRMTVDDMVRVAQANGYSMLCVSYEASPHLNTIREYSSSIPDFIREVSFRWPSLSLPELYSSICHIVFKKN